MGVLALLDEECLFPKGSDKSYLEKLNKTHADKSSSFVKAERSRAQYSEFEIAHYAGTVRLQPYHQYTTLSQHKFAFY